MSHGQMCTAILFSATIALDLAVHPVFGQNILDSLAERQWSVTFSSGITSRGPESDIENSMIASGFNQSSPSSWFGSGKSHPFSRASSGLPWAMALRYAIDPPFQLAFILSNATNGETVGYREPLMYLFVNYSVLTIGALAYVQGGSLRFGIGPALSIVKSWLNDAGKTTDVSSVTKLGALIDLGVSLPAHSRFFVDLDFQYCLLGNGEIGPYTGSFFDSSATMPASRVNFSGFAIAIGLGIRF